MIIKSFNLKDLNIKSDLFLFYGENEGHKEEIIKSYFLKEFDGEIIKYDENQILDNKNDFFETCLNESLFSNKKFILISRVTTKMYEIVTELLNKEIYNKKIIFNSAALEKKSKIRQLFEKEKKLVCVPFYEDNNASLFKIAANFFREKNISISSENINLIIEKCSGDRKNLYSEMNKIQNYCIDKKSINKSEIIKLINLYEKENFFELIDSCLSRNQIKVRKIINSSVFGKNDAIILIRSFISRLKRLIQLKNLEMEFGNAKDTVENFKPPIFWKDKSIVQKQIETWSIKKVYDLLEEVNHIEMNYKKNSELSNNLIFDLILNTSNN